MALNLSTLTSPATSGDVLQEVTTTADFLESVPVFRNLARGSNKGGDAEQSVALNQPRALPLIKNPQGNLGGYLYIPNVTGNYATGPSVTIGSNETWQAEVDMVLTQFGNYIMPFGGGGWSSGFGLIFRSDGFFRVFSKGNPTENYLSNSVILGATFNVKYGYNGTEIYADIDGVREYTATPNSQSGSITNPLHLAQDNNLTQQGNYAIQKAKLTVNSAVVFDCDFNGSTSIRHGDTKFQAAVGGPVTINQSGNDPATIIKKPVLRFDGANSSLQGLFNQTIDGCYMFAAFSVLGDGGEFSGRVFSINSTGQLDSDPSGSGALFSIHQGLTTNLRTYVSGGYRTIHPELFDDANGDILHESLIKDGTQLSRVNNADQSTTSVATSISAEEFSVASRGNLDYNTAIDLEFLALFPATITDAQADAVRNYINNRNNVFYRWDTDGYYFFDPQKATFTGNFTDANTLDGYITGSDLGDTDVRTNLTLEQPTLNDQPYADGYKITFNDSAEHLEFDNAASQTLAGWQVVGTSLGTFAYRVNANAVTELNLLGNAGSARFAGDLYGIILLSESATGRDIEQARKLLIDRGAADGVTPVNLFTYWFLRTDIVEFKQIDTSSVTSFKYAWKSCSNLESFPLIDTSNATIFEQAFYGNSSLNSFPAIQAPVCSNFISSWQGCSSLTSFPAGAKLGTEASNVNFTSAWRSSGLTSFPALDLSRGSQFPSTWRSCSALTSFPADAKLGTAASNVNVGSAWNASGLTSFSTPLPTTTSLRYSWYNCSSLTSFSSELPLAADTFSAWRDCSSLTDFSADVFSNWNPSSINNGVFDLTWDGCTSLTAQSVENILTSIDASGKYATTTGASGGTALADAGIDIDYNVATGSLSAATTAAITSLKAKGWSIFINSVEQ